MFRTILLVLVASLILTTGCSQSIECPGTNVLLISIDTCRADRTSPYGFEDVETLTLQALAEEGVLFEDAHTPVPLTTPAHSSLLTGWHPARHGVRDNASYTLNKEALTLAEIFQQNDYATAGFVATLLLSRQRGMAQGFDTFDDEFPPKSFSGFMPTVERSGEEIQQSVIDWLETNERNPFFLFVHLYDPHLPYNPPSPWKEAYRTHPYAGEIAYADYNIGKILAWMVEHDILKDTLVVLVADHGESLWEHHEMAHGMFLYESAMHVPFIIRLPDRVRSRNLSGARVQGTVTLLDVMPTILELEGIECPEVDGTSLVPCLKGEKQQSEFLFAETMYPLFFNWSPLFAVRDYPWKFILAPEPELYNLAEDPEEMNNLYNEDHPEVERLRPILEDEIAYLEESAHVASINPEKMNTLVSLGYVAGGTLGDATVEQLPDPKSKTRVYILIDEAISKMARGDLAGAEDQFLKAAELDPENPSPYLNLGDIYSRRQQWEEALFYTEKTLHLSPHNLWARVQLAGVLIELDRLDEARGRLLKIRKEYPLCAMAHFGLGRIAEAEKDYSEAIRWFSETLHLMPTMPGLRERIDKNREKLAESAKT